MTDTYTALTTLATEADAVGLSEAIEAMEPTGVGCFELEDGSDRWEVGAYFMEAPDETQLALLAAAFRAESFVISRVEPTDWVAQVRRELSPVEAGRFIIHGGHDRDRIPANRISLEIEAAMAFGTGHHGTTEGCLLAFEKLRQLGLRAHRIADIGCGTGVLTMGAMKAGPGTALASDIDRVAVATAKANLTANGVGARVRVREATGYRDAVIRAGAPYDLIFMNILARPLMRLAPDAARHLAPGGVVILSGLLHRQAPMVSSMYRAHGFVPLFSIKRRGWTTLCLRKGRGFGARSSL